MKTTLTLHFIGIALTCCSLFSTSAQCPAGTATATLNWDQLDYLPLNGGYSGFVTTVQSRTQHFAIGTNRVTIQYPATITTNGENVLNTAEAGSFGQGADVEYYGNGDLTITFDQPVYNLRFSLYDIDQSQSVLVTASDPSSKALLVNMASVTAGVVSITGSGSTAPAAFSSGTAAVNADTKGTINITIDGNQPAGGAGIQKVTISAGYDGSPAGNFWLSDLTTCVGGSFPLNYYASQKPWTGQPGYYLVTPDNNSVYMMNPLTGRADWLFSEPASPWINSMAYDHVNHILYYVMDHPTPVSTNKAIKKYDFNTETIATIIPDISAFGIPLYEIVVESAGAAFYNGSLFIGVEGTNSARTSGRESIVWRIDFDAAQNPVRASQVFARPADNGSGTLTHDWGDFIIKDGVLYNFNTGNSGSTAQFIHHDMQTGNAQFFNTNGQPAPIQAGQTWDGKLYWTGGQSPETGRVARYNENGTIGTKITATVTACSPPWAGRAGDASDPFRPKSDFGDAPSSYDPIVEEKATHEYDCNLRLGATYDREWDKTSSVSATADGSDEDGIQSVTVLSPGPFSFVQEVSVYNRTGTFATVAAWLDVNGNGSFETGEGRALTVPSSSQMQKVLFSWLGLQINLPPGSQTFLRVRISSAANGLTTDKATGWFANGEVEDYPVMVDISLPIKLLSFSAKREDEQNVSLQWSTGREQGFRGFELERSADGGEWHTIAFIRSHGFISATNHYWYTDRKPLPGKSYYRLRRLYFDGRSTYSEVRSVEMKVVNGWISVSPNPVPDRAVLRFYLSKPQTVTILLLDATGKTVYRGQYAATRGTNAMDMNQWKSIPSGVYLVQLITTAGPFQIRAVKQ